MPELPEVERGRRIAARIAAGRRIVGVRCAPDPIVFDGLSPGEVERALEGRAVVAARRWGKQLWLEMSGPPHPLFHFGMTGALHARAEPPLRLATGPVHVPETWPPRFWKLCLELDDGGELVLTNARRLGRVRLRDDPENEPPISTLGFDPLLALPSHVALAERLARRSGRIKSLLLDQRFVAGVGNWIADEVLYQSGISPFRRANGLGTAEVRRLRRALGSVVREAVRVDADSARFPATWLFHQRWGRRDGAVTARGEAIEHADVGGRTTAWVPTAQR